jgi:isopentenyl-diphosphate Delta-isomerase
MRSDEPGQAGEKSRPRTRSQRIASRKDAHISINLERDVQSSISTGLEAFRFDHTALPEINLDEVDLSAEFLGRRLAAPYLISCMTGGTAQAETVNRTLADVAQRFGIALGLGSARVLLDDERTARSFQMRALAPDVPLLANIGGVQLNRGVTVDDLQKLVDLLDADALVIHLNPLQESLQEHGDVQFRGILDRIAQVCRKLTCPVIVKEVGFGIGGRDADRLFNAGVYAVDVAGGGGTSWSEVESHLLKGPIANVAGMFRSWGTPTADCLLQVRAARPEAFLIGSGGIRTGIDAAVALALGADLVGVAGPLLRAAATGRQAADDKVFELIETLRRVLFCTGSRTIAELRQVPLRRASN